MRNEFQIKALNEMEAASIDSLRRGMKVVISIADGYVVRFSVLTSADSDYFSTRMQEQLLLFSLARNQLVDRSQNFSNDELQTENKL